MRVLDLLSQTGLRKLSKLLPYGPTPLFIKSVQVLLDRFCVGNQVEIVLGNLLGMFDGFHVKTSECLLGTTP